MTNINMNKNGGMIGGKAANHPTHRILALVILSGSASWRRSEESVAEI
jgi:hypothetical protein